MFEMLTPLITKLLKVVSLISTTDRQYLIPDSQFSPDFSTVQICIHDVLKTLA